MSRQFNANQFEGAFRANSWEITDKIRQVPKLQSGFTVFISNNKGHLLEGVKRSNSSPWGNFVNTWDLPLRIPGNSCLNSTSRRLSSANHLSRIRENFHRGVEDHIIQSASSLRNMKIRKKDIPNQEAAPAKDFSPSLGTTHRSPHENNEEEEIKQNTADQKPTASLPSATSIAKPMTPNNPEVRESKPGSGQSVDETQTVISKPVSPNPGERPESKSSSVQ